jgi:hypothetical protein
MNDNLIYDKPCCKGQENCVKRARQFLFHKWSPLWECGRTDIKFNRYYRYPARNSVINRDAEIVGLPYSSVRVEDKIVGLDILLNTFMTAVDNPISILYTRNMSDFYDKSFNCGVSNVFFTYGVVCSAFISYCLDLPLHRSTREMETAPEFFEVTPRNASSINIGDTLVTIRPTGKTGGHIRIITGIARDKDGNVKKVEIAEGIEPTPECNWYTTEEFEKTLLGIAKEEEKDKYRIFRYRYIDNIREPVEYTAKKNSDLMLNYGEYSNYHKGDKVEFNILCDADELVIEGDKTYKIPSSDFAKAEHFGNTYTIYSTESLECGKYIAYCVKNGEKSAPVSFIVAKTPDITVTKADGTEFEKIALKPVDPDGNPLTKDSKCLYAEDGTLSKEPVTIALSDGKRNISALAAVKEKDGEILVRFAANLLSEDGTPNDLFKIGDDTLFYAYSAEVGTKICVKWSDGNLMTPVHTSWKEQAAISFNQRLITDEEIKACELNEEIYADDNSFVSFEIHCENEYGKLSTKQYNFVV